MASKRVSLNLKERYILSQAIEALKSNSNVDKSFVADLGREQLAKLQTKIVGSTSN